MHYYRIGVPDELAPDIIWLDELEVYPDRTCKRAIKNNARPGKTVFNQWFACSECGKPMNHDDRFCSGCGARVEEE